jgi:uncharacterized membrane protein YqjE
MTDYQDERAPGLFGGLKGLVTTVLASAKVRLELLGNELEEEKLRAINLVVVALGMVFCLGLFVLISVAFVTVLFWDSRLVVLGLFTGLFLVLALFFYSQFKRLMHRPQPMFAASIAELQEDLRHLKAAAGHEQHTE